MMWKLRFAEQGLARLRHDLLAYAPLEASAILLCNAGASNRTLVVEEVVIVPNAAYLKQTPTFLSISPAFLAPLIKRARTAGQSLIFAHTHPGSKSPQFSPTDDEGEARLLPAVAIRVPDRPHGSLVLGSSGFSGRITNLAGEIQVISDIFEIGGAIIRHGDPKLTDALNDIHDRNVRALGKRGQALLRELTVGIIGLGGTGSHIAQQLAYLGVGKLVLLDDDVVALTNLNRLIGATPRDVDRPKVQVAAQMVEHASGFRTKATAHKGSVTLGSDAQTLNGCDFLFSCTDTHASRAVINQFAYQYLVPTIDMGVRIDSVEGTITSMSGRVQMLSPGLACLQCTRALDPELVRQGLMTAKERREDRYIVEGGEPQPSVVSLNGVVSSLAVTMFIAAVTGFPARSRRGNYLISQGAVRSVRPDPLDGCLVCSSPRGGLAKGRSWPMIWRHD